MSQSKGTQGSRRADSLRGNDRGNSLRGRQGNDTVTGGGGDDTFVFERSFAQNGLDTITDYSWSKDGSGDQDILDLTAALMAFKAALMSDPSTDIADYVWLEQTEGGVKLMVDLDGSGVQTAQQWAMLSGLTAADQVRIRAFTASGSCSGSGSGADLGNGYFTLSPVSTKGHLFVLAQGGLDVVQGGSDNSRDTYWLDDGDGMFDPTKDTNVTNATDNIADGADFANREWTVEFLGVPGADKIDLTGFGSDDHIIINANAMNSALKMWGNFNPIVPAGTSYRSVATAGGGYIANNKDSDLGYTTTIKFSPRQILQSGFSKPMEFGSKLFKKYSGPTFGGGFRNSVSMNAFASSAPTFTGVNAAAYLGWPLTITNKLGKVPISFMAEKMAFTLKDTSLKFFDSNRAVWAKQFTVINTPFPQFPDIKTSKKFFASYRNSTSMSLRLASGLNSTTLPSLQVIWPEII